jgi:rubrerythrin
MSRIQYTKELLENVIPESESYSEALRKLGRTIHGGMVDHLKKRCEKFGIDTSHMKGKGWSKGTRTNMRKTAAEILVRGAKHHGHMLRRALIEIGVPERCSVCGLAEWQGEPIRLEVHHKDGDNTNCTRKNLEFNCPNCHSQTENYRNR